MNIQKISENIYEIEKEDEMNVPARIYASEELLKEIKEDKTLEQIKNVAALPGIQKHSIVMPDGHQGYGFPIGGVAGIDMEKGVISPGGIGYDINCLTGDSEVLLEFGRARKIEELKNDFAEEKAAVTSDKITTSDIQLFTEKEEQEIVEIKTETDERIECTLDHPFLTENGMKEVKELSEGEKLFIRPFKGVADEDPEELTLLTKEDFQDYDPQIVQALEKRDLLPLKTTDREFNILLKLIGFHTGDGSFNNNGDTTFYAEKEDLEEIRKDIRELGFKPSKIYSRERNHEFNERSFQRTEHSIKSTSNSLQKLMIKLGAPEGTKTDEAFTPPRYIDDLAGWQKALYLSAFFGAEMSSPSAQNSKNLYCPKISQNKSVNVEESGHEFMEKIKEFLEDLDVRTNAIESLDAPDNQKGKVKRFRLGIKNDSKNLIRFFSAVGYRYNLEKQKKAMKSIQYLKTKHKAIDRRENIARESINLYENGIQPKEIKKKFEINDRFIERSIYSGRKTVSRPPKSFPDYDEFIEDIDVKDSLIVGTRIKSIEEKGTTKVYDIGVKHDEHNFQANQFIVSNCGVRLLQTDLNAEDIKGHEKQLANILFSKIPCGLGGGGYIETNRNDLEEILEKGMEWMLENGHAKESDLERCEENGRLPGDASKIPKKAKDRGNNQVGSLGSGNHFMEVQVVDEVFDTEIAETFGLEEGQVVVMIHSGSRGLGHQTCTHYLREFEKNYPEIVETLPDKELIYAPVEDRLGQDYLKAMYAAANFAWCNRQAMTQGVRDCLNTIFDSVEVELVYDVCHNIAKEETHTVNGEEKDLLVHRKGATRAMPKGREEVPDVYSEVGQPVLLPGTMGTSSYVLVGGENSPELSFGSTAHGAGRLKSRTQAKEDYWGETVQQDLEREGVHVKAVSGSTIAEEAPGAYKDIDEVIRVSDELGIGKKVAKMKPVVNIKG